MEQEIDASGDVVASTTKAGAEAWGGVADTDTTARGNMEEAKINNQEDEEEKGVGSGGAKDAFVGNNDVLLDLDRKTDDADGVKTEGTAWQVPERTIHADSLVHFATSPAVPGERQKKIMVPPQRKHIYYFKARVPALMADSLRMEGLETLRLQKCYMEAVPRFIDRFKYLRQISLNDNKLSSLPEEIGFVKALKFLSLAGNKLMNLPGSIGMLKDLEHLNLARNQIIALPDSLSRCTKITDLYLFDNKIASLPTPTKVKELWPNLRLVNLSKNSMVHLPPAVGSWKKVSRLDLSANLLVDLPDEFCDMSSIDSLNLADNQLTRLPEQFGKLRSLTIIHLERNNLKKLPDSIYDLLTVRELNLFGNPMEPLEDIPLWNYGDPIHRFKDTAKKIEEVTPVPILRSEPGAKSTEGIRFMKILCDNHFSIQGCRYGDYCMFSHIPPPLPVIPYQKDKESLALETSKKKTKYYGLKHSKYAALFEEFGKEREKAGIDHNWRENEKGEYDDYEGDDEDVKLGVGAVVPGM
jgi:Leucine-rich repeat (LRR) protein